LAAFVKWNPCPLTSIIIGEPQQPGGGHSDANDLAVNASTISIASVEVISRLQGTPESNISLNGGKTELKPKGPGISPSLDTTNHSARAMAFANNTSQTHRSEASARTVGPLRCGSANVKQYYYIHFKVIRYYNISLLPPAREHTAQGLELLFAFSFSFYFFRDAFFTLHLSGTAHKLRTAFARLSNQHLAFGRYDFFDFRQIWKERFVDRRHGSLSLIQPPRRLQGVTYCGGGSLSGY
jgi:hypothetical protein